MTAGFKHRLLGATILILAGIIFLPDLLDGEKQVVKDDFKVIPDRPEFQGVQQPDTFDQAEFDRASSVAAASQVTEKALDSETTAGPAADQNEAESLPSQAYAQVTLPSPADATTAAAAAPADMAAGNTVTDNAWVVRVGSFSNPQNANALVAKLRQEGYVTFTRDITNSNGQKLTSVLVGPELRKSHLEQKVEQLQQLTGIARLVVSRYQVTENN
ncbi:MULTISPECIES: SPOR domain-containing protein [unclassified Arsukibacterium]|uniref:SPOR domain-containing protein n=1 Tax=unclassified Arsukibacterium TaxID=2635278 RepID=UPI000C997CCA|nr:MULTISPECIES: SPOR domain-containing protein [unclassified Arsukibacterium]MAA94431.1 dedD protein [Rheinheimera sp.]HAW91496.1 dedD protein [Candidatus Azambacteria bacterium]|tara:strand:- start:38 stop:685 length:648 start_codon:yes stop_codon:yes gene_type:complete